MSRRLDVAQLWAHAQSQGITAEVLAHSAGSIDRDRFMHLTDLEELSAVQLVAIADTLQVAVDELLIPVEFEGSYEKPSDAISSPPWQPNQIDHDDLVAALLRYGDLPEHTVLSAFGWTAEQLAHVVACTRARPTRDASGVTMQRTGGRIGLTSPAHTFGNVNYRLSTVFAENLGLEPQETVFLAVAIRAHGLGSEPGPPPVPSPIAEVLAGKRAALPRIIDRRDLPVPLVPHPDLLYALDLAPAPTRDQAPAVRRGTAS